MFSRQLSKVVINNGRTFSTSAFNITGKGPIRVAITGASGQIGYQLCFRIASGEMLGKDQPVILQCLELPQALNALKGVAMELDDCAFPLLKGIVQTDVPSKAFKDADYALLVGARPRSKGMERGDLLAANAEIFSVQGKALNDNANINNLRVLVVGNPANTNALIAARCAPNIDPKRFSAMTRLDHNRGLAQLSQKLNCSVTDIKNFAIWGNHSATQYPDITNATFKGKSISQTINDQAWVKDNFIPTVQKRGAAIIEARGSSSAASAASAAIDHMRDWTFGTNGEWTSMAVLSDGAYGAEKGLYFSYPVVIDKSGKYEIVPNVKLDSFSKERIDITNKELISEREGVAHLLPK